MREPPLYASRYPGYDVLAKSGDWDEVTRAVIERRVRDVPRIRFFARHEADTLQALADVVLPQDDRPPGKRVPIVEWLDARLAQGQGPGYRFEDLPEDRDLWRRVARALDAEAREGWGKPFPELHPQERERLVERLARGEGEARAWGDLPLARTWSVILTELVTHYYAHPYAWSEIGFGGPKFPRIYPRPARDNEDEAQEVWHDE